MPTAREQKGRDWFHGWAVGAGITFVVQVVCMILILRIFLSSDKLGAELRRSVWIWAAFHAAFLISGVAILSVARFHGISRANNTGVTIIILMIWLAEGRFKPTGKNGDALSELSYGDQDRIGAANFPMILAEMIFYFSVLWGVDKADQGWPNTPNSQKNSTEPSLGHRRRRRHSQLAGASDDSTSSA